MPARTWPPDGSNPLSPAALPRPSTPTRAVNAVWRTPCWVSSGDLSNTFLLMVVEVGQHSEHPAMPAVAGRQVQLQEDVADVLADRPLGDHQRLGDGGVV